MKAQPPGHKRSHIPLPSKARNFSKTMELPPLKPGDPAKKQDFTRTFKFEPAPPKHAKEQNDVELENKAKPPKDAKAQKGPLERTKSQEVVKEPKDLKAQKDSHEEKHGGPKAQKDLKAQKSSQEEKQEGPKAQKSSLKRTKSQEIVKEPKDLKAQKNSQEGSKAQKGAKGHEHEKAQKEPKAQKEGKAQRETTAPLQTLSKVCRMRFEALIELVKPLSEKGEEQEIVTEAVQKLRFGEEEKEIERKIEAVSGDMAETYETIIEREPEIGKIMTELTKVGDQRDVLVTEIEALEKENEASKPRVTKAELKEMQENQKKFEMMLNTQQTKYQLRYTKAKNGVEAVASSIASIQNQISSLEKRIQLMNQKGSQYSHKTHSHQHVRKTVMEGTEGVDVDRPKTYRKSALPKLDKRSNL